MDELEHTHHHPHHHSPPDTPPRSYIRDTELLNKIFPKGYDPDKEHFARTMVHIIGYSNLFDLGKTTIEEVDIQTIYPSQSIINKTRVIEMILYLQNNEVPGYPVGIKVGEDVYLLDGHHRVSAQILMGKKKVMMQLTVLQENSEVVQKALYPKALNPDSAE